MLKIGYRYPNTDCLGPGRRYALWLQGCERRCPGCASPELQPLEGGIEIGPLALAEEIAATQGIAGVTVSGGEPMLQAADLARLLDRLHSLRADLSVIVYSGFTLEQLTAPDRLAVLAHTDLLIDGDYRQDLNDNRGLRGSTNQRLHFLTDRLRPWADEIARAPRRRQVTFPSDTEILTIGLPDKR